MRAFLNAAGQAAALVSEMLPRASTGYSLTCDKAIARHWWCLGSATCAPEMLAGPAPDLGVLQPGDQATEVVRDIKVTGLAVVQAAQQQGPVRRHACDTSVAATDRQSTTDKQGPLLAPSTAL